MSQCANWLIRTTSRSLLECKITILGKQSQENERREVRIYTIKEKVKPTNAKSLFAKRKRLIFRFLSTCFTACVKGQL